MPKTQVTPSQDKGRQSFSYCLEINTYTMVLQYLIRGKMVDKFQWCLDNLNSQLINSQTLVKSMKAALAKKKEEVLKKDPRALDEKSIYQLATVESDILHRLFILEKKYEEAFQVLVDMRSPKAFTFFEAQYQGFKYDQSLLKNLMELISIDCKKLVYFLLKKENGFEQQKVYVDHCAQ